MSDTYRKLEFHSLDVDDYKEAAHGQLATTYDVSSVGPGDTDSLTPEVEAAVADLELDPGGYLAIQRTNDSTYVDGYSVLVTVRGAPSVTVYDN